MGLNVKRLRELLDRIPDEADVVAYEGEGVGLVIRSGEKTAWIETGERHDIVANETAHDLSDFGFGQD